jgi:hypothetical protein
LASEKSSLRCGARKSCIRIVIASEAKQSIAPRHRWIASSLGSTQ